MKLKNIGVLISRSSWLNDYAELLISEIKKRGLAVYRYDKHEDIESELDVLFILSYFRIIDKNTLFKNKHNIVVHESDLPAGKGWAPYFWQILEGCSEIPVVLFEATEEIDAGVIYLKDYILLDGTELNEELRNKQALKTIELCLRFIDEYHTINPVSQIGKETFYAKRKKEDSELNIDKTIREQINLLRIVNNDDYPAFFYYNGVKYIINISKEK